MAYHRDNDHGLFSFVFVFGALFPLPRSTDDNIKKIRLNYMRVKELIQKNQN
jgi:hypothetical protein